MASIFEQIEHKLHHEEPPVTTPAQPSVFARAADVLTDLDGNLLVSKLYEGGLGKRLTPYQVQTVIDFVTGIESAPLSHAAPAPAGPQPVTT